MSTLLTFSQTAWSLADLFPASDSPEFQQALTEIENLAAEIEARRPLLQPDITAADFADFVRRLEALYRLANRLYGFAELSFSANTQNPAHLNLVGEIQQRFSALQNRTLFFELWWKDLDNANQQRLLAGAGDERYWLENMLLFKPHTLSEAEEKVVNLKNVTGSSALQNLYDTLTNRYSFKLQVDGQEKELTRGELMMYVRQNDPALRAAAYQELLRVYAHDGNILGQIYQALVRDWRNEQVQLRGFGEPIAARNLGNSIPDEVVNTLLEVCRQNRGLFQRYFQLKAKALGLERLRRYDLYAGMAAAEKQYPFEQGVEMTLAAFEQFSPQTAALARRVFEQQHLDSEVRKGKRSGAFCAPINPNLTPWVLVNYQGQADDVATLAHELGHAVHSMLAEGHSQLTWHSTLPLAETASTFAEMLLIDKLLAEESDTAVRRSVLFRQMDDAYGTIMRQAYFAMFERQAHQMIADGASIEALSAAYLESLKEQYGDAVEVSDDFRWEWAAVPHFYHTPFYVYAYTFGQLLVLSLYQQYKREGEAFKPRYLAILSAGGSASPEATLSAAGIDMRQAAFWQGGFDVLAETLRQLEAL